MNLRAHRAVLEQSPVFAILLKHKQEANQTLCIKFPHQSPPVVHAILQYLYGRELLPPIFDTAQKVEELCEAYTAAGDLELDILQDNIIDSLDLNEDHDMSESFLYAAQKVYEKCAARLPFRDLFKRKIKKTIHKGRLDESSNLGYALRRLVAAGGELAIDIAQALMEGYAASEVAMMCVLSNELRASSQAADVQYNGMREAFESAQKQAESDLEIAATMATAAQHQRESAEIALENQRARAQFAEARLHEVSQQLESLKKASSGKLDMSNTMVRDKNWERKATRTTGPQMSGRGSFQDGLNEMEDEGLVAIASKSQIPQLPGNLAFKKGDRITNIVSKPSCPTCWPS